MTRQAATKVLDVGQIQTVKASSMLAERVRTAILDGELSDGEFLPPEREMMTQSGLSRATVREALRILESEGFIETRRGAAGGAMVCQIQTGSVVRSIDFLIRSQGIRFEALHQAREAIEPACARLAALNHTDETLAAIEAAAADMEAAGMDIAAFRAGNVAWHLAIAEASANELLIAFMGAIANVFEQSTVGSHSKALRNSVLKAHGRVTRAIAARDGEAAERFMRQHVAAAAAELAKR